MLQRTIVPRTVICAAVVRLLDAILWQLFIGIYAKYFATYFGLKADSGNFMNYANKVCKQSTCRTLNRHRSALMIMSPLS